MLTIVHIVNVFKGAWSDFSKVLKFWYHRNLIFFSQLMTNFTAEIGNHNSLNSEVQASAVDQIVVYTQKV